MEYVRKEMSAHNERENKERLQWHPAFYAEIQIELEEESANLIFENEYQLGTKPKEVDVLIIKKNKEIPIHKNIGRIFRKHNIIEYKSPEDSLGVDDFYRVLGYTYFYKADTKEENIIKIEDITVTFVSSRYPRALERHLLKQGDVIEEQEAGIYYIKGEKVPIQLIVTSRLSEEKNFWLKNLTNELRDEETVDKMLREYEKHKNNVCYRSVMDIVVRANEKMFKGGSEMCDALWELFADRIEDLNQKSWEAGEKEGKKEGISLTKRVFRMDAEGISCEMIAEKCLITIDEVREILAM